jgi:tetratricopeptide (TPR) repeat protein
MSFIRDYRKRQSIQEILEHDERFEVFGRPLADDQYRYIVRATHKESGKEVVIKIPLTSDARNQCLMPYNLVKEVHEPKYLARVVGDEPVEFKGEKKEHFGVLLVPAAINLEEVIQNAVEDDEEKGEDDKSPWENEIIDIFAEDDEEKKGEDDKSSKQAWEDNVLDVFGQAASTLSQIHRLGYVHRDIKLSNLLGYDDEVWVIADYGTVTKHNPEDTRQQSTHSAKNAEQFQSPEFIENKAKGKIIYSIEEDIFAFGIAMYMALTKKVSNDLHHKFSEQRDRKGGYQAFIEREIPNLDISDRAKHFLKRLLGRKLATRPQSGKTVKDYRYRSIDIFIEEFQGNTVTEDVEDIVSSEEYNDFLKSHKTFVDALNSAEHNRDGKWETINYETIDRIMRAHEAFLELANREKIKLAPKRNELVTTSIEIYEEIRAREDELLRSVFKKFESGEMDEEEFWPTAHEIVYLWGPPFTDRKEDRKPDEKAMYTLEEISTKNTHFHDKRFKRKSRKEETSDEGKSLVELLDGFGELSDKPSQNSEEASKCRKSGDFWFGVRDFDRAISKYKEAIELDSSYTAAYNNLGVAKRKKKDFDGAIRALQKAIEISPMDIMPHNSLGNTYSEQGKYIEALDEYKIALDIDPENIATLNNKGVAWYHLRNYNLAVSDLEKAVAIDPENPTIHYNLANVLNAKGEAARATSEYKKAMDLSRKKDKSVKDVEEEIREAKEAIEKDSKDKHAYFKLGLALSKKGDKEGSKEAYEKAIEIDPDFSGAHNNLGVIYNGKGNTDEAIRCYREAIRCDPKGALYHNNLARTLEGKGELDEAEKEYKEAIDRYNPFRETNLSLGGIYWGLGDFYEKKKELDKAIETYREGIKNDPNYIRLQRRLQSILEKKKDAKEIIDDLKKQGEGNPSDASAQVFLGIALSIEGDPEGAKNAYERAAKLLVGSKGETIDLME